MGKADSGFYHDSGRFSAFLLITMRDEFGKPLYVRQLRPNYLESILNLLILLINILLFPVYLYVD